MPTRSIDLGQVESIAQDYYLPVIRDQYFLSNALYYSLKQKGRVRHYNGGRAIFQPLSFAPEGGGGQWWSGVDKMDTRIRNPITGATFYRKNYSVPIIITRDEEDSVGKDGHKIIDLVDAKMNIAKPTAVDAVGTELYNDGSDARKIGGLLHICALQSDLTTAATQLTYGGITTSAIGTTTSNAWWQPQQWTTASQTGASSSFAGARGFGPVGVLWSKIRKASGKSPTMIVSNTGAYQDFHDSLTGVGIGSGPMAGGQRFMPQDLNLAKAGFENLMYKTAAWVLDERAPQTSGNVGCCFMLNEDTLNLVIHEKRDMSLDGWYNPYDQRVRLAYIDWSGEIVCSERRANGVIGAINVAATA